MILHIVIVILLTLCTQVGGIIWILSFGFFTLTNSNKSTWKKLSIFFILYLLVIFTIVPVLSKLNGRTPLPISRKGSLIPHNYITVILNRHYVKPKLKKQLIGIADNFHKENKNLKVSYLDANFPFIDGFPLLPHISHNDGRKVDLSFFYTKDGTAGNLKPSNTGYGKFVEPKKNEFNQTKECIDKGSWQYDFTKFLCLGSRNDLMFDQINTKKIVDLLTSDALTQKVLIEPHLKNRMSLTNNKIRFQGCHAVRHDDHIHHQIVK